jgi:hypothetical protein
VIAGRRTKQSSRRTAQAAIGAKHQNLRRALIDHRERITLVIPRPDNPASKFNRPLRYVLIGWKLVSGKLGLRAGILRCGYAARRECQRQRADNGSD